MVKRSDIKSIQFIGSFVKLNQCPEPVKPEYAFIGRSNVGKSSLINMITGRKSLAKTSSTPGKTQTLNYFLVDDQWYIVDLPGYGFAKKSKKDRESWGKLIHEFLIRRENLACTFVLVDSRHESQKSDLDIINWLGSVGLPFCIVFTKADKISRNKLAMGIDAYKATLNKYWSELPPIIVSSSQIKMGKEAILDFINTTNKSIELNA